MADNCQDQQPWQERQSPWQRPRAARGRHAAAKYPTWWQRRVISQVNALTEWLARHQKVAALAVLALWWGAYGALLASRH
jgi:hypothetical protein